MDDYGTQLLKNLILKIDHITKEEYIELFEKAKELDSIEEWRKQDAYKENKV